MSFVRKLIKRSKPVWGIWKSFHALAVLLKQKEKILKTQTNQTNQTNHKQTKNQNQKTPNTKLGACFIWL